MLDDKEKQRLRQAYLDGVNIRDLERRFGVTKTVIYRICEDIRKKQVLDTEPVAPTTTNYRQSFYYADGGIPLTVSKKHYSGHIRVMAKAYNITLEQAEKYNKEGYWNCTICKNWVKEPKVKIRRCEKCRDV